MSAGIAAKKEHLARVPSAIDVDGSSSFLFQYYSARYQRREIETMKRYER
jgi:hypothetical protein